MKIPDKRFVVSCRKFEERIRVRPVSNVVLLPRRTKLIDLGTTVARLVFERRATDVPNSIHKLYTR